MDVGHDDPSGAYAGMFASCARFSDDKGRWRAEALGHVGYARRVGLGSCPGHANAASAR
jgi:hypothetical protein